MHNKYVQVLRIVTMENCTFKKKTAGNKKVNIYFNGAEQLFCKIILWVLLILCEASKHVQKAHCFTPAFAYLFMQKPFLCTQH